MNIMENIGRNIALKYVVLLRLLNAHRIQRFKFEKVNVKKLSLSLNLNSTFLRNEAILEFCTQFLQSQEKGQVGCYCEKN